MTNAKGEPLSALTFNFNIFNAGGTVLLVAGLLTAVLYGVGVRRTAGSYAAPCASSAGPSSPSWPCSPLPM